MGFLANVNIDHQGLRVILRLRPGIWLAVPDLPDPLLLLLQPLLPVQLLLLLQLLQLLLLLQPLQLLQLYPVSPSWT